MLPGLVGHQRATELMLFGKPFTADHAHEIGMVNEVFADRETLWSATKERIAELQQKPAEAMRALKKLLRDESASQVAQRLDLDRRVMQA